MKNQITIFFLLVSAIVSAQNPRVFTVKCNVSQTGGGAGYWQVSATNINDPLGLYDATEIATGDALYLNDGGIQYKLNITTVVSAVGNSATFRVSNSGITGISSVPTTSAVISRGTPNHELLTWTANASDADNQANQEWNNYLIDSLLASGTSDPVVGGDLSGTASNAQIVAGAVGTSEIASLAVTNAKINDVDYSKITNTPATNPSVYFAPGQNSNPNFQVFASAIVRPSNSFSNGTAITWELLNHATDHNSSFFTSANGNSGSNNLQIKYPRVKYVINMTVTPDETFALHNVTVGPSVGVDSAAISAFRFMPLNLRLRGAGTSTWSKQSSNVSGKFIVSTIASGLTRFNVAGTDSIDYTAINVSYIGARNWHAERKYSALGAYNAGFQLRDSTGAIVTANPSATDEIIIHTGYQEPVSLSLGTWQTTGNKWMGTFTNFWIFAVFECYMVASPVTTTSIEVRWQTYSGASSYKIYRSTDAAFTSPTLIYSGTNTSFVDSGLTSNTKYWYKYVPVISGVDTEITTFTTYTKP